MMTRRWSSSKGLKSDPGDRLDRVARLMSGDTVQLDLPATGKYLNLVSSCIEEMLGGIDGLVDAAQVSQQVQLAVHEACANIVEHAYEGTVRGRMQVTLTLDDRSLVVDLRDSGKSFDPARVLEPNLAEGQIHGYGLFIMREVMDEVTYEPSPGNNRLRLVKEL